MTSNSIIRQHITFTGSVQGVGFRYRAHHAADLYGCTGWVRNEYDGSVTMEIQGTQEQINEVVAEIDRDPYIRIERMKTSWLDPVPDERGFRVRH